MADQHSTGTARLLPLLIHLLCRSCNLILSRLSHDCVRFIIFSVSILKEHRTGVSLPAAMSRVVSLSTVMCNKIFCTLFK